MASDSLEQLLARAVALGLIDQQQAERLLSLHAKGEMLKAAENAISSGTSVGELIKLIGPALRDGLDSCTTSRSSPSDGPAAGADGQESIEGLPAHFSIRRRLPGGGMGRVYEAFDAIHHRRVAIKISKADQNDAWLEKRLQIERVVVGALSHPSIVTLHDSGTLPNGQAYVVMEYIDGAPLTDYADSEKLDFTARLRLFRRVALAIAAVHRVKIVHRDLKPTNILVQSNGRPTVLDFGLAKSLRRRKKQRTTSGPNIVDAGFETLAGVGTRGYRSPEQRLGRSVTRRSDVFTLGVILHELLTGIKPVELPSSDLNSLPDFQNIPPVVWPAHVPTDVRAVAAKCLAIDPAQRYADARKLASEIGRLLRHQPVEAVRSGRSAYRARKFLRRNRLWVTLGVLALGVLALGNLVFFQSSHYQAQLAHVERESARTNAQRSEELESIVEKSNITAAVRLIAERRYDEALEPLEEVPKSRWGWECDRLALRIRHAPGPRRFIGLHKWMTTAGALSPDGTALVTTGFDGRVLIHRVESGVTEELAPSAVPRAQFEYASDNTLDQLASEAFLVIGWQSQPESIVAARADGRLARWNQETKELREEKVGAAIVAAAIGPGGRLWCATDRNALWQWDGVDPPTQLTLIAGEPVMAIALLAADKGLVALADGHVSVLDARSNTPRPLAKLPGQPVDMAVTKNGRDVWIASRDHGIAHVELSESVDTANVRETLRLPPAGGDSPPPIERIAVSAEGNRVFAADAAGGVASWDVASGAPAVYRKGTRDRALSQAQRRRLTEQLQNYVPLFASSADGKRLYVGGQNAAVIEWSFDPLKESQTFVTPSGSQISFDPTRPGLLWIGQLDGRFSVRDLATNSDVSSVAAHPSGVRFLLSARQGNVVFSSDGRAICRWRVVDDRIVAQGEPLDIDTEMVAMAIDLSGARIAACHATGQLAVYDSQTGRKLSATQLPVDRCPSESTFLAFNSDGSRLAVATAPRHLWVLNGRDLTTIAEPAFFAREPTALVFHTTKIETLIGADALGRSIMWPEPRRQLHDAASFQGQPIAALAVTPDGQRVAFASRAGHVVISDAAHELGPLLYLHDAADAVDNTAVRSLQFDARGERLAMLRESGTVHVWDNTGDTNSVVEQADDLWHEETIARGPALAGLHVRDASVALDIDGRLGILFKTRPKHSGPTAPARISLASESQRGWQFQGVYQSPPLDNRAAHSLERSLALATSSPAWLAYLRRPHSPDQTSAGELLQVSLSHWPDGNWRSTKQIERHASPSSSRTEEVLAGPDNLGFDTFVGQPHDASTSPTVLHFSHRTRELLRTARGESGWHTRAVGHLGDGFDMTAVQDRDGRSHVVFAPTRFDGDPQPPVYMRLGADGQTVEAREYFDDEIDAYPASIALDADNRPVVVAHERHRALSRTFVSRRDADRWRRIGTLPVALAKAGYASRPVFDTAGAIHVVALHYPTGRLHLFIYRDSAWTCHLIGHLPMHEWRSEHAAAPNRVGQPALRQAPDGSLLVVVGVDDADASSLLVLREPKS